MYGKGLTFLLYKELSQIDTKEQSNRNTDLRHIFDKIMCKRSLTQNLS